MKNLLDTKTASFQEILGNGKIYKIPDFQRDYSWKKNHWEDLWEDLLLLDKDSPAHYMGTIVLQNTDKKNLFIVVDGQQRLTTFTIIIISIIKILKDLIEKNIDVNFNRQRIKRIQSIFIGEKTISKLHYESKLKLNKNNNLFFQEYLLVLKKPHNYNKLRDSEKALFDAYNYFYEQLGEKFKNDNGEKIGAFLENIIADKLIFIQIVVDNELSAYNVFETLNARGMDLTTTDLLKNYLFSISAKTAPESEMEILKEKWTKIVDTVGLKIFPVFLRYFLNSRQKLVRETGVFKVIKNNIKSAKNVFDLLEELEKKATLFNAIKNPEDEFWNDYPEKKSIQKSVKELKLFGISQPIPLLFSLLEKTPNIFDSILKKIVVISFRYNVIAKRNPNDLERLYNEIARKIFNKEIKDKSVISQLLEKVYINDEDFKNIFSTKEISTGGRNKNIVKYIFTKIENHISNTDNDFNDANFTIEHILPENYSQDWDQKFMQNANKFIYRLGNYTLLESKLNKKCGNKNYEEKKEIYSNSRYKLTKEYVNYDEWNIEILNSYQVKLAKQAISIWKMN